MSFEYEKYENLWIVDAADLSVMTIKTHDEKYKYEYDLTGKKHLANPAVRRYNYMTFKTKEEALNHRVNVIDEQIRYVKSIIFNHKLDLLNLENKKKQVLG